MCKPAKTLIGAGEKFVRNISCNRIGGFPVCFIRVHYHESFAILGTHSICTSINAMGLASGEDVVWICVIFCLLWSNLNNNGIMSTVAYFTSWSYSSYVHLWCITLCSFLHNFLHLLLSNHYISWVVWLSCTHCSCNFMLILFWQILRSCYEDIHVVNCFLHNSTVFTTVHITITFHFSINY